MCAFLVPLDALSIGGKHSFRPNSSLGGRLSFGPHEFVILFYTRYVGLRNAHITPLQLNFIPLEMGVADSINEVLTILLSN